MKKLVVFSVLSLVMSVLSAQASDPSQSSGGGRNEWRLYEYNFNCQFGVNTATNNGNFAAAAKVFAWVDHHDHDSAIAPLVDTTNKMAVLHNDELIYADGAILNSEKKFVSITALDGSPAIFVKRESIYAENSSSEYHAFLKIGHHKVEGTCRVRSELVRH